MSKRSLVSILVACAGLLFGVLALRDPPTEQEAVAAGELLTNEVSALGHTVVSMSPEGAISPDRSQVRRRVASARGLVLAATNQAPLGSAVVSARSFDTSSFGTTYSWQELDWEAVRTCSLECVVNDKGEFHVDLPPKDHRTFVTASCIGHVSRTVELLSKTSLRIELEPGEPIRVRVQWADSQPVRGALVTQSVRALALLNRRMDSYGATANWFAENSRRTDELGNAHFAPLSEPSQFVAEHHGQKSLSVLVDQGDCDVVLRLRPSIRLSGRVHFPSGFKSSLRSSVVIFDAENDQTAGPVVVNTRKSGHWGPVSVPLPRNGMLRVKASAEDLVPDYQSVNATHPGTITEIDLYLTQAELLFLRVIDEMGTPIPYATIYARWPLDSATQSYSRTSTSASGECSIACPVGSLVTIGAEAEGFSLNELHSVSPVTTVEDPRLITLMRAGVLRGKCVFPDLSPSEFKITFWNEERDIYGQRTFSDNESGEFIIESVPIGQLAVLATSDHGQTPTEIVEISAASEHEAVLEFGPSFEGHGFIVDGLTGEPLEAGIRLHAVSKGIPMYEYGPLNESGSDGRFLVDGLSYGDNYISFECAGYSSHSTMVSVREPGTLNLGRVRLSRSVSLQINVTGHEERGDCWLSISGPEERPQQLIPQSGIVRFEGVAPGTYQVGLTEPDLFGSEFEVDVPAMATVKIDCSIPNDVELKVSVITLAGNTLPPGSLVAVMQRDALGRTLIRSKALRSDGTVTMNGLFRGGAIVDVSDSDFQALALHETFLETGTLNSVRVNVAEHESIILLVDESGEPLPDSTLVLETTTGWRSAYYANSEGQVALRNSSMPRMSAAIFDGDRRDLHNHFELHTDEQVILVLDSNSTLSVSAEDGGQSISSLEVFGRASGTEFYLQNFATNASGTVTWSNISEGPYELSVEDLAFWPLIREINVSGSDTHVALDVRRRGNILLTVLNEFGTPISNAEVSLTSNEYETSVTQWLAEDLVISSTGTMRTDNSGTLRVSGVPHGEYSLSVNGNASTVTIPPHGTLEHELRLEPVH